MNSVIEKLIQESIDTKIALLADEQLMRNIQQAIDVVAKAFKAGNKVLFCGNGGSAADAQHLAAEFSGRFYLDRDALPSEALHVNTSYLTAVANDYSYDVVYARMVKGMGHAGDVLIGLSTSGNSTNIVNAFHAAKEKGMATIAFTGESGGALKDNCDLLINIPSNVIPRIQESHILVGHIICELVEASHFADPS